MLTNLELELELGSTCTHAQPGTIIDVWFLALISLPTAAARFIVSEPSTAAATDGLIEFSVARGQSYDPDSVTSIFLSSANDSAIPLQDVRRLKYTVALGQDPTVQRFLAIFTGYYSRITDFSP